MRKTNLVLIVVFLIALGNVLADGIPTLMPQSFYGTILNLTAGNDISALIGTTTVGTFTLTQGNVYGGASANDAKLVVCSAGESVCTSGATITFYGTSGCTPPQTTTFVPGAITNLDLTCTIPAAETPAAGAGGGGAGGGGAAAPKETITEVTNPVIIDMVKSTLPADWTDVKISQIGTPSTEAITLTISNIDDAIKLATDTNAISALQAIKNEMSSGEISSLEVSRTLTVYKAQNKLTGEEVYRSEIKIVFTAPNDVEKFKLVEIVPKDVAQSSDDLIFIGIQPTILQKDPILQWIIDSLKKGDAKEFKYIVKKKLSSITSTTLTAGKEIKAEVTPPTEEKPPVTPPTEEKPPTGISAKTWVGIIIIVIIVLIGLWIFARIRKKKEK